VAAKGGDPQQQDGAAGVRAAAGRNRQTVRAGKLHCQQQSMHGNPWLRLLRREVEALVKEKHGANYLRGRQAKTELAHINQELKRLKNQMAALEDRKSKLIAGEIQ
jgi:hypothetical protein